MIFGIDKHPKKSLFARRRNLDSKFGPPALLIGILLIITFLIVLSVLNPYLYSFLICMSSGEAFKELWVPLPSDPTNKRYLVFNMINLIFKSNYN